MAIYASGTACLTTLFAAYEGYIREYHYTVSAIGDHFLYRTFLKMVADYATISQECSNFCKKTAKKFVLPPIFQKVRLEVHKKFTFFEYFWYGTTGIITEVK